MGTSRAPNVELLVKALRILFAGTVLIATGHAVLAATATPAGACSCLAIADDEAFTLADAVFTGTPTERREPAVADRSTAGVTLVFSVDRVYKGAVAPRQEVRTPFSSASCGLDPPPDARLLVFAAEPGSQPSASLGATEGQYVAFLCGGTRTLADAPVPAEFGSGRAPVPDGETGSDGDDDDWVLPVTLAVGALGVAVAAGLWARARRRPS